MNIGNLVFSFFVISFATNAYAQLKIDNSEVVVQPKLGLASFYDVRIQARKECDSGVGQDCAFVFFLDKTTHQQVGGGFCSCDLEQYRPRPENLYSLVHIDCFSHDGKEIADAEAELKKLGYHTEDCQNGGIAVKNKKDSSLLDLKNE